jgi:hypothetical protein
MTTRLILNGTTSITSLFLQGSIDLQDLLALYSVVVNTTTTTANNVRSLIASMRVKRLTFWSPPVVVAAATSSPSIYTPAFLWCRLGSTNNANTTPIQMPNLYFTDVTIGATEPGYLNIPVPSDCVLGQWFGGAATLAPTGGSSNGAFSFSSNYGTILDINYDAVLTYDDDFAGDSMLSAQYRDRTWTNGTPYLGQVICLVPASSNGSATVGFWTAAPPLQWQ